MPLSDPRQFPDDESVMHHALRLAARGIGAVEPNPAVGAVIVNDELSLIAAGFHQQFGDAHAEINALDAAGERARGARLFVTLEPCCHQGKTPPCADAVIAAGVREVVIGCQDPALHVAGKGIAKLQAAGIAVTVGICEADARELIAPFRKLMLDGLPWVHAKWAMTLDGRIATRTGHSKWISGEESRAEVHRLRGQMDAIITGAGTVRADGPLLTARPAGPRTALRVVVDRSGESVSPSGQLMRTIDEAGVLICVEEAHTNADHLKELRALGAEVLSTNSDESVLRQLLKELGRRQLTNVLVEAGGGLQGSFFDENLIDEVHVFIAPKIVGGREAVTPVSGRGLAEIPELSSLRNVAIRQFGDDVLIEGRIRQS
ncbi:MAG TPA: bifunctional diaminohydroxyphosphoribosylaminopyrimidine deaminase/5-amino-6-(5-phosphoribosylamino)uracil reductase RibD [Planctomycetes bacterium]|nr:bifunctional diaminohydroxyphosphoribosylaminopyrimidine deaminase/5-amino-6-(5-phosphoribosylamino)uracil reductase RibD [Fuerstiella sp.]HIK91563.1 bifunctional diaminohydroxyphosphoribosylaminopyrimidine deaminase/5-amino-6-(5-phosphoribosylamino)uracil reductase RibD [Planctomycetota bacterium]